MKNGKILFKPENFTIERIDQLMDEAKDVPLVLVVAPMGYGKTTVISNYLQDKKGKKIWLTHSKRENTKKWGGGVAGINYVGLCMM